jgi:hypothetical protein
MVVFTNMYTTNVTGMFMTTTGYCGCGKQVLEETHHLGGDVQGAENWVGIFTNVAPRQVNLWRALPVSSQRFYRVKQIP